MSDLFEVITAQLTRVVAEYKRAAEDNKITFNEAVTLFMTGAGSIIQLTEQLGAGVPGEAKKAAVLAALDRFYTEVIAPLDIAVVPNLIEPAVDNAIKNLLLTMAGAWIDAMVNIFNKMGWPKTNPTTPIQ